MATVPEITIICIDNSSWLYDKAIFETQINAIKFYCETKFKCNPNNLVGIYAMAESKCGFRLYPTNDLKEILCCLEGVRCTCYGDRSDVETMFGDYNTGFYYSPRDMKKRLLMFVGSPINLKDILVKPFGRLLKRRGVALSIVNFYELGTEKSPVNFGLSSGRYHCARSELGDLVTIADDNDNSRIVDVVEESTFHGILSSSILSKNLRYLKKKDKKKVKKNVDVKQELDLPHNEE